MTLSIRHCVLLLALVTAQATTGSAQQRPARATRNVIVVVTDGFRWQEVFRGADRSLMGRAGSVSDSASLLRQFWRESPVERRETLLPFVWGTMSKQGQLFGDSANGSVQRVLNNYRFSYPGYREMLPGVADPRIDSNEHGPNENTTVFEWLNSLAPFKGKVAAFGTWGAFTRIFNTQRSGLTVYGGWETGAAPTGTTRAGVLKDLFATSSRLWHDVAVDALMHQSMLDYLAVKKPRVMFIGYGETDEWAHSGRYDMYLQSAHQLDANLAQLWQKLQADPQYRGSTTLIVTTDHGRGYAARWRDHGQNVDGAQFIWTAVLGPDTPARGVVVQGGELHQAQLAATIANALGYEWKGEGRAPALSIFR